MNKRYSVKITESALSDMDAIYDYISGPLGAPIAAAKQYDSEPQLPQQNNMIK